MSNSVYIIPMIGGVSGMSQLLADVVRLFAVVTGLYYSCIFALIPLYERWSGIPQPTVSLGRGIAYQPVKFLEDEGAPRLQGYQVSVDLYHTVSISSISQVIHSDRCLDSC